MAYAIGTCLSNIFGQSLGAARRHHQMGNIDWKLGIISIIVSLIGFEIGSTVVLALEKSGNVGEIIRWFYVVFLSGLGSFMFYDYFVLQKKQNENIKESSSGTPVTSIEPVRSKLAEKLYNIKIPPMISFPASQITAVSIWIIIIVFLFTGFFSGLLGIGGGFIIMPTLIYLIGLPTIIAVGTSLITVLFSSAYGCFIYALHGRVELYAAFILLIGASIGAQVGSTAVRYVKGYGIRLLFAIMIIFAGFSVTLEQFYKLMKNSLFRLTTNFICVFNPLSYSRYEGTMLRG